jgi:hypothetical protein
MADRNGAPDCYKCRGTGRYTFQRWPGGKGRPPQVVRGVCYACEGKGWQTPADEQRNRTYWRLNLARIARGG